jgi:hypothetical protein
VKKAVLLLSLCTIGCSTPAPDASQGVPQKICSIAFDTLNKLVVIGQGTVMFDDNGGIKMPTSAWNTLDEQARKDLAKTLAYHAACRNNSDPMSEHLEIRDFNTNRVIAEGFVWSLKEI